MIATRAQYETTQDRIRRFSDALDELESREATWLRDLQARDIRDQINVLEDDLAHYDELRSGKIDEIVVDRLADLPRALIKARILAGLSQQELAREAGQSTLKIQQWERDEYSRAPTEVMRKIASVLPIRLRGRTGVGGNAISAAPLRTVLTRAGLPREVYDDVIVPSLYGGAAYEDEIDRRLNRLFGMGAATFLQRGGFEPVPLRFKLPGNAGQDRTRAYASYVDGVCDIIASTQPSRSADLPQSWSAVRALLFPDGIVDLRTAVHRCWELAIGVIGLRDRVAFHGAARRVNGQATIVLKPSSRHESRWLFNLVHEIFHLVSEPEDFTLIEGAETSVERRQARNERRADRFAAMVLTNGNLPEAFARVASRAGGGTGRGGSANAARLATAVQDAAAFYNIPLGILANLVAEEVRSSSRINWWGTANNLQPSSDDPWKIVRDVFVERANFSALESTESALLWQILETRDE